MVEIIRVLGAFFIGLSVVMFVYALILSDWRWGYYGKKRAIAKSNQTRALKFNLIGLLGLILGVVLLALV